MSHTNSRYKTEEIAPAAIREGLWTSGGWLRKTKEDPTELNISNYFKNKLLDTSRR